MGRGGRFLAGAAWLSLAAALVLFGCAKQGKRPQVVVIGLDGATWEILQPWIDRGDLPTLAALQRESAWGELQSSVPFLSPPAWTTAVTGVNPGKHAIFDFERRLPQSIVIVNEDAKSRRAQPVWNVLQSHARRSLLMNIPMTDPPDEVLGLCVAGFPHLDKIGYTFPPDLQQKLGDYPLDALQMKLIPGTEDSLLALYREGLEARRRVAIDWLHNEPFDLFWMVFTDTDRIQHTFWVFMDPQSPNYDPQLAARYGNAIHDFWVEQDRALGDVLAAVPAGATVLVLSDHGFGPIRYDVKLQNLMRMPGSGMTAQEADGVYVLDPSDAARILIARRGRDPGAVWSPVEARRVRDKLATLLRNARDPRTGANVCERVWTNEELFHGTYAEKGPDLVVLPADGYFMTFGDSNAAPECAGDRPPRPAALGLASHEWDLRAGRDRGSLRDDATAMASMSSR